MPDITMCANFRCEKRDRCHRYTAIPSQRQSYAFFSSGGCSYFETNEDRNQRSVVDVDAEHKKWHSQR